VTDRVSAFDVVMTEAIPSKGQMLTQLSAWWCRQLDGLVRHHVISTDADEIVRAVPSLAPQREIIDGRATLCWRTVVFPVECVVRGHLAGSAWKEYSERGTLAGERLPRGLVESQALTPPLFSPATKAATGHDQNITVAHLREIVGARRPLSWSVYRAPSTSAAGRLHSTAASSLPTPNSSSGATAMGVCS
jgi:phosphoribosylaminoimidazole-succinocarboxamide synthase